MVASNFLDHRSRPTRFKSENRTGAGRPRTPEGGKRGDRDGKIAGVRGQTGDGGWRTNTSVPISRDRFPGNYYSILTVATFHLATLLRVW